MHAAEASFSLIEGTGNTAHMSATSRQGSEGTMKLDGDQFERQKGYETALYYRDLLHSKGLITKAEHLKEMAYIERKYKPIIVHIPLLNKE